MYSRKKKKIKFMAILFVLFLFTVSSQFVMPAEWTCEDAFQVCFALNFNLYNISGMWNCIIGYSFCKNYVEQFL